MARNDDGNMAFQELKEQIGMSTTHRPNPQSRISEMRSDIRKTLEIRDREQFVNRYQWITTDGSPLPEGFDPDIVERILYYRYKLVAFMYDDGDGVKLYTTPFAHSGRMDVYGRYRKVMPLTFNGTINYEHDNETDRDIEVQGDGQWITDFEIAPAYSIYDTEPVRIDGKEVPRGVILQDFENGISQNELPRFRLSKVYNELLADNLVLIRHNLVASARVFTYRVLDEGQKKSSLGELQGMEEDILDNGQMFFPVTSSVTLDTVFDDKDLETQEYWECFVSIDNLRENMMGIENNGIFKKKERELEGEAEKEASQSDLVYQDGLHQRQKFCEILDTLYGLNLWCIESDAIDKVDVNDDNYDTEGDEDNESQSANENV